MNPVIDLPPVTRRRSERSTLRRALESLQTGDSYVEPFTEVGYRRLNMLCVAIRREMRRWAVKDTLVLRKYEDERGAAMVGVWRVPVARTCKR